MKSIEFKIVDKNVPKKQGMFSIRMDDEDIQKLQKYADEQKMNFHRFIKSILFGYIEYRESNK